MLPSDFGQATDRGYLPATSSGPHGTQRYFVGNRPQTGNSYRNLRCRINSQVWTTIEEVEWLCFRSFLLPSQPPNSIPSFEHLHYCLKPTNDNGRLFFSEELPEEVILGDLQGFHCDSALLAKQPPRLSPTPGRHNNHSVADQPAAPLSGVPVATLNQTAEKRPAGKSSSIDAEQSWRIQAEQSTPSNRRRRTIQTHQRERRRRESSPMKTRRSGHSGHSGRQSYQVGSFEPCLFIQARFQLPVVHARAPGVPFN